MHKIAAIYVTTEKLKMASTLNKALLIDKTKDSQGKRQLPTIIDLHVLREYLNVTLAMKRKIKPNINFDV